MESSPAQCGLRPRKVEIWVLIPVYTFTWLCGLGQGHDLPGPQFLFCLVGEALHSFVRHSLRTHDVSSSVLCPMLKPDPAVPAFKEFMPQELTLSIFNQFRECSEYRGLNRTVSFFSHHWP